MNTVSFVTKALPGKIYTSDGQVCDNYIITGETEGVANYYPFGMLHNNTAADFDNAYQYKYNGKELQETGMYDYGERFYMPDIGRWGVVDQLAEKYRSTSPYGYVMNKPIMFTDPDGRYASQIQDLRNSMPNVYSGWENAQGVNFGDWNNFSNGSQFNEFVSQINASGLGGGGYTFTGNAAGSMYHYFADGGNINGITFKNGWAMWGTLEGDPYVVGYDGDMYLNDTGSVVLHRARVEEKDFFTNLANNQYFSAGHLGISESISRFGNYAMGRALNHSYINFTVLNDLGRPYIGTTVAGIRMSSTAAANISKVAKYGGGVALGLWQLQQQNFNMRMGKLVILKDGQII